jgi:hypothetical protein
LVKLLEKDYSAAIRSGFAASGIAPFNVERPLSRLPREPDNAENAVQQQLINRLSELCYNPPPTTAARRPKQKEKLPAGAAYGGAWVRDESMDEVEAVASRAKRAHPSAMSSSESSEDSSSSDSDSDEEEAEERRRAVANIVERLRRKKQQYTGTVDEEQHDEEQHDYVETVQQDNEEEEQKGEGDGEPEQLYYRPASYIACIYQNAWYVGEVMDKTIEPEAVEGDEYVLVSFMEWTGGKGDQLRWPKRKDVLNVLKVRQKFQLIC